MSIFSHHSTSYSRYKKGFTLIELLVVMAIMVIVTGIMLVRQSKFDSSTILHSLAYSVALSMRQAQVYGTSVLGTTTAQVACAGNYYSGNCYAQAYGVYFSSGSPGQYILFADLNGNGQYDPGEDVKVFSLSSGYTISQFCVTGTNGGAVTRCSPSVITSLSVLFKRPNPDAAFYADFNGTPIAGDVYSSATIYLQNTTDLSVTRSATITNTGLISAQ